MSSENYNWRKSSSSNGSGECVEVANAWRKSSKSNGSGNCVEVASTWRKSSKSNHAGNCVEVADTADVILVRDTTNRDGGTLSFTAPAWQRFITGL